MLQHQSSCPPHHSHPHSFNRCSPPHIPKTPRNGATGTYQFLSLLPGVPQNLPYHHHHPANPVYPHGDILPYYGGDQEQWIQFSVYGPWVCSLCLDYFASLKWVVSNGLGSAEIHAILLFAERGQLYVDLKVSEVERAQRIAAHPERTSKPAATIPSRFGFSTLQQQEDVIRE